MSHQRCKTGRPKKSVDWNIVDEKLQKGCSGVEISAWLGISFNTLYAKCRKEKNIDFNAYSQIQKSKGNIPLREIQYDIAVSGDKQMLIWLGKQRLGQSDKSDNITASVNIDSKDADADNTASAAECVLYYKSLINEKQ